MSSIYKYINKITCGNCIDILPELPDNSVTMTLTDIPYGVINRHSNGLRSLDKGTADIETFNVDQFMYEICRVTKGSVYVFCSTEQVSEIRSFMANKSMSTRLCIFEKTNPSPMNGQQIWLSGVECCIYGKKKGATFHEQ